MQKKSQNVFYQRKIKLAVIFTSIYSVVFTSCSLGGEYSNVTEIKNSPKQISDAKYLISNYNKERVSRNYENIPSYLDMRNTTQNDFQTKQLKLDSLLGIFVSSEILTAKSIIKLNSKSLLEYSTRLTYKSNFKNKAATEEFEVGIVNDTLKIVYYNIKITL